MLWCWAHFHVFVGICMLYLENVYSDHLPPFKIRQFLSCCWFIWGLFVFNFDIFMFNIFHWFANSQNPYVLPQKAFIIYSTPCLSPICLLAHCHTDWPPYCLFLNTPPCAFLQDFVFALLFTELEHPSCNINMASSLFLSDFCSKFYLIRETFLDHIPHCYSLYLLPYFSLVNLVFIYTITTNWPY